MARGKSSKAVGQRQPAGSAAAAAPTPTPSPAAAPTPWLAPSTAGWVIRAASLWLLAGAFAKAVTGSPSELPAPILESELDPFRVIAAAVVVEFAVGLLAILRPRYGWVPLALTFAAFVLVLVGHIGSGAEACGCFGGALSMPAGVMLAIDAALALAVVGSGIASRAWPLGPPLGAPQSLSSPLLVSALVGVSFGWIADARLRPLRPTESRSPVAHTPHTPDRAARSGSESTGENSTGTPLQAAPDSSAWRLPDPLPPEVILRPVLWINKRLAETELGRFTDVSLFPATATVVIYYESCNHCADHLRELALRQEADPSDPTQYVLVQLPTPQAPNIKLYVDRVPRGLHVKMPEAITRWVITPPWDVFVEGGVVRRAERVKWSGEK